MNDFHGVFPYLVSPIDDDGRVKGEVRARLVEHLAAAGVHGLTPLGSTGEFAYLSFEQKRRIVEVTVETAAGRLPVVAGVAATTTADAVRQGSSGEGSAAPASSPSWRPISRCRTTGWSPTSAPSPKRSTARSCCTPTRSSSAATCRFRRSSGSRASTAKSAI